MDFTKNLGGLKIVIDKELEHQFDSAIRDARKKDILIADALQHTKKIALAGGKRIRGALLYSAYVGLGGKEKKKIIKVAAAIELVHLFLLVHDDIIDRGDLRHGEKTLHKIFAGKKQKNIIADGGEHFGESVAIIAGDMLYVMANRIIIEAGFDPTISIQTLLKLQSIVATTIVGQSQDIAIAYKKKIVAEEVLAMYENKTARYTIEGPLQLGAILAGCNERKTLDIFSHYAIPLGTAFQIQDDILGIFGDKKKMGKSAASDIEEGKKTLMVVKAYEWSTSKQKKQLDFILGKKNPIDKEIKSFQEILKATGAYDYTKNLAAQYLKKGKKEIEKAVLLPGAKNFLTGLAEYLEGRDV